MYFLVIHLDNLNTVIFLIKCPNIYSFSNYTDDQLHVWFDIETEEVYRSSDDNVTIALASGRLYTPSQSAACGRFLENGSEYILTGHAHNGQLSSILCDWGKRLDHLNDEDKQFFENGYKNVTCT